MCFFSENGHTMNHSLIRGGFIVRRIIGLVMFSVGAGMVLMLLLPERFSVLLFIAVLLIAGYNLFCSWKFSIYKNIVKRHAKPSRLTILLHGRLSSFHKTGFQTGSANIHFPCGFSNLNPYGLDVGLPHPIWSSMRVAHIVSKMSAFSANCTFRHNHTSLQFDRSVLGHDPQR